MKVTKFVRFVSFLLLLIAEDAKTQESPKNPDSFPVPQISPYNRRSALEINPYIRDYSKLPIKPSRTLSFSTDESSSLNLDISTDGQTLLFTILGEIFIMPANGGKAIQLTRGMAVNSKPVWSPDGKYIAFISDATGRPQTHIRNLQGDYHVILNDSDPSRFSTDTYSWDEAWEPVWLPNTKSLLSDRSLFNDRGQKENFNDSFLKKDFLSKGAVTSFSVDGKYFFTGNLYSVQKWQLFKIERNSGDTIQVIQGGFPSAARDIRISPDGRWICYIKKYYRDSDGGMYCYDTQTRQERLLLKFAGYDNRYDGINGGTYGSSIERYCFSSSGDFLYIGYGGRIHKIDLERGSQEIIPFKAEVCIDMGSNTMHQFKLEYSNETVLNISSAQRSNDESQLVFCALKKIYIIDLPNGKPRQFSNGPGVLYRPCFSPNNREVAYLSHIDSSDEGRIYISSTNKIGHNRLISTIKGEWTSISWSPDGLSLGGLYVTTVGEKKISRLVKVSIQTGKITELKRDSSFLIQGPVTFSPDGKSILCSYTINKYSKQLQELKTLLAIDILDGHEEIRASTNFLNAEFYSISPDGKYFIYSFNEDLFIVPVESTSKTLDLITENRVQAIRFAIGGLNPHWEQGGKILSWSWGDKYYYSTPEKIFEAAKRSVPLIDSMFAFSFSIRDIKLNPEKIDIQLPVEPFYGKGTIVLQGARIITMNGDVIFQKGTIVITDGRIAKIGHLDRIKIPANATVVDVNGKTIMPGMIDLHEHVTRQEIRFEEENKLKTFLAYGVTTAIDPSSSVDMFGYQEVLKIGSAKGPRYYSVGKTVGPGYGLAIISQSEAINEVRKRTMLGAIAIKQYKQKTRLQQQWLLIACNKLGVNMTNESPDNIVECVGQIKNGTPKIEHVIRFYRAGFKDFANLIGAAGTYITATNLVNTKGANYFRNQYPELSLKYKRLNPQAYYSTFNDTVGYGTLTKTNRLLDQDLFTASVIKNGCKVPIGSHGDIPGIGFHYELWNMTLGGISNLDALRAATLWGAEGLGLEKDLGSIKVGKIADLIILDKNPLEDIHNSTSIRYVMKDGVLYDGNTLDIIWPVKKELRTTK